jgi:hypothetical protein
MVSQAQTPHPLQDLADLVVGVKRIACDEIWRGGTDLAVEGARRDGAFVLSENREHSDIPVRMLRRWLVVGWLHSVVD